jgi:hypothetical protein
MSKITEIEINKTLIDEAERIKQNECRWVDGDPIVNVKNFEIKFMQMSWLESSHSISFFEGDIADDTDKKKMVEWMMREGKSVKILPLIITSNIYLLAILATLSKTLSSLIKNDKTYIDKIEIDFLVGKGLIKHSKFIKDTFDENYRPIIPDFYDDDFPTVTEINFSELKSLLNILIVSLEIEGVDLRKIIKRVNHTDIKDYCHENVKFDGGIEQIIKDWTTSERRDGLPDAEGGKRIKDVSLNEEYNITAELLKIVMSFSQPTDNESRDKIILIVATPVKDSIKKFFTEKTGELNLDKGRLDDIMFVSYTNPTGPEDPEVIVRSIPSYLTILSKYINLKEIVYAIDEYFHSKMMDTAKSRKFQCEKFHEEIISEMKKVNPRLKDQSIEKILEEYADEKKNAIRDLIADPDDKKIEKYIKKQKRELEVINEGFLTVQNDILEQLKHIL